MIYVLFPSIFIQYSTKKKEFTFYGFFYYCSRLHEQFKRKALTIWSYSFNASTSCNNKCSRNSIATNRASRVLSIFLESRILVAFTRLQSFVKRRNSSGIKEKMLSFPWLLNRLATVYWDLCNKTGILGPKFVSEKSMRWMM